MRLLKCYVENFGTISHFTYEFAEGLNIINEMNGWGKTTFAVFIKAMFYGMESTTKRNLEENERKKYMPWNGGKFGGYLVFKLGDKVYRVERFFGNKEREDYFNLYDEKTNLESDDFTDKLGEEIFKIDREAFARSTFVPQQQIKVTVNDSISAKLTNMIESDNDINNYEIAVSRLDEAVKAYKKKGDKGRIAELEAELRYAEAELNDCVSKEEPYEQWKRMQIDKQDKKYDYDKRLEIIDKNIEYAGGAAERCAKKAHYEELNGEVAAKQEEFAILMDFFCNGIPEYEDLNKYELIAKRVDEYKYNLSQNLVCDADRVDYENLLKIFSEGVPSDNEFDTCEESIVNVMRYDSSMKAYTLTNDEINEFNRLEERFHGVLEMNDVLSSANKMYKRYVEISSEIEKEKNDLTNLENMYDINSEQAVGIGKVLRYQLYMFAIGMLFVVIGLIVSIKSSGGIGAAFVGFGAVIVAVAYVWKVKNDKLSYENEALCDQNYADIVNTKKKIDALKVERKKIIDELNDFSTKYSCKSETKDMLNVIAEVSLAHKNYLSLKHKKMINDEEIWSIKRKRDAEAAYINQVLGKYYIYFGCENDVPEQERRWRDILRAVRDKKKDFVVLNEKISIYDKNKDELNQIEPELLQFINNYYDEEDKDASEKRIQKIKMNLDNYHRLERELDLAIGKLNSFREKNENAIIEADMNESMTLDKLRNERRIVVEKINSLREELDNIKVKCAEYAEVVSRKPEFETEVDRIKGELDEAKRKFELLSSTKNLLEKAKSQFSSRYLTNLNKSFNKYITMLNGTAMSATEMDTMLNINFEAYGAKKELDYMSTGYKDLFSFCTRLALVDAMFVEEHPFLILDDPFVNLDKEKIENALELIKEVSLEYQIIYFVCHSSRI